jgi:F-type H+-transporting ATPase subunit b
MKKLFAAISLTLAPVLGQAAEQGTGNVLEINWGLWIWTALTFLVLFALLAKLAFKPITAALDRRNQTIKAQLDEAERSRAEAKKLMDEYQRQLAEARSEANKVIEEARSLGEKVRKEVVEKANAESSALVQRAQEEIERQKEKGVQELKDTVAQLAVQIASRVLEKEINEATHRQLVDNLIKDFSKIRKT